MKQLLWMFALLILACGCAPRVHLKDPESVSRVWSGLNPEITQDDRLTAHFSLQVQTQKRTGRLLGQLWGYSSSLVRLDLASSVGTNVAMIRETPNLWAAYIPSENLGYHHADARIGLQFFDIPVPFTARQIGSLLAGDLLPVLNGSYSSAQDTPDGKIRFTLSSGEIEFMDVTEDLDILVFHGKSGWTLTCEKPYEIPAFSGRHLYEKFTFQSAREGTAVLRVKSLEHGGTWKTSDLDLRLPEGAQWMRLKSGVRNN